MWIVYSGVFGAALGGLIVWLVSRSVRRWPPSAPGRDPEAQQAEARLWSTHNADTSGR